MRSPSRERWQVSRDDHRSHVARLELLAGEGDPKALHHVGDGARRKATWLLSPEESRPTTRP